MGPRRLLIPQGRGPRVDFLSSQVLAPTSGPQACVQAAHLGVQLPPHHAAGSACPVLQEALVAHVPVLAAPAGCQGPITSWPPFPLLRRIGTPAPLRPSSFLSGTPAPPSPSCAEAAFRRDWGGVCQLLPLYGLGDP